MASTDVALTGDELEAAFNAAVSWVSNPEENAFSVPTPTARQLILYGFYKQATKGDNNTAQPWMVQVTAVCCVVLAHDYNTTSHFWLILSLLPLLCSARSGTRGNRAKGSRRRKQ